MIISFTGHRPNKLWGYNLHQKKYRDLFRSLYTIVMSEWKHEGDLLLVSGMALGVDQVAAMLGIWLRDQKHLNVQVEAAVPCIGQDNKWPQQSRDQYQDILSKCNIRTIVYNGTYNYRCMQQRNEYMVNKADVLIAVWDGSSGGTGNCVHYAEQKGVKIIQINPKDI